MKEHKKSILISASVLGLGAFFVKFIGAIYRIPLTNILKSDGIGLYQMVFPVYALLLDFSGAGVPSALSKLIAEKGDNRYFYATKYLNLSIKFFSVIGLISTIFILLFASKISAFQGNENAKLAYITLCPSIFFVCLISCYRGVFQGLGNMRPTALSQIIEQVVKVVFGLILALVLRNNTARAVSGATFAITLSEITAFIYLYLLYKNTFKVKSPLPVLNDSEEITIKKLIKAVIPITLIAIITPFSQVIDSFLIMNMLKYTNATSLYGLYSGVALTIVNLPISICHGLAVASIPSISSSMREEEKTEKANYIISITFLLSLLSSVFVFIASKPIVNILYPSLNAGDKALSINLIKSLSVVVLLLSIVQTQNSIFIARGKYYIPLFTMLISVAIKSVIEIILLNNRRLNIFGGAIALIACYFITYLLNSIMMKNSGERNASKEPSTSKLYNT